MRHDGEDRVDISIVIVNWNTCALLRDCLDSVYRTVSGIAFEVFVVDNASTDGSVAMVRESFPAVRLMANNENRGFGAANNQAFRVMGGRYALLLNSDTVLTENAVRELFLFMESSPRAAMACGQLLNRDGSKQNSMAAFPTLWTLLTNMSLLEYLFPSRYPSKRYEHREPVAVDSGIGACLLVRKAAMDEVGFFDERYYFFFEETDWAYAMRRAGWEIYHVPSARIFHLQGQSIGANVRSRIEFYRSRYQYFRKWHGDLYYRTACAIILGRLVVNWFLTALANLVTFGCLRGLREKQRVYTGLLAWHVKSA